MSMTDKREPTVRRRGTHRAPARPRALDWEPLRAAPARDAGVSALCGQWLHRLPQASRPLALCTHYPRIAHRIALCWDDPTLRRLLLDQLVIDRRGLQPDFPPEVQEELAHLHALHASSDR
jgi:hypothetical protein